VAASSAYLQLAERLVSAIASGEYALGSRLPTEAQLCADTGLSRGTVRQALHEVEILGMISRKPGDGSRVVALAPVDDYQPIANAPDDLVQIVRRTKIIHPQVREVVANAALAQRLGARRGTKWNLLEGPRVRRDRTGPPLCWSEQYLPASSPGLDDVRRGAFTASQAAEVETEQLITAELLDPELAEKLESNSPVALVVIRRQRDESGALKSVGIHTHPADRYQIRNIVTRQPSSRSTSRLEGKRKGGDERSG